MFDKRIITVSEEGVHKRIDTYIPQIFPDISRNRIQQLIKSGFVQINNRTVKAHFKLRENSIITLIIPPPEPTELKPYNVNLDILYEDDDIIVVNKPAGMVTHPTVKYTEQTLVNALIAHCRNLSVIGGVMRPGIVHRLDKDTAGIILIAKNDVAHNSLTGQFRSRKIKKTYIALARGIIAASEGFIRYSIDRHPYVRVKMKATENVGKEALTTYRVLKYFKNATLLELMPHTGRTHQLRVHLSTMGYPILGDPIYSRISTEQDKFGLALCSKRIEFMHPVKNEVMRFEIDLPQHIENLIKFLEREIN